MKAVLHRHYGPADLLELGEVPLPHVGPKEVLVRVHAASVNPADWRIMRASPFLVRVSGMGLFSPKHPGLGQDVAGTVEAVGSAVTRFRPGDAVYGGGLGSGTLAEFVSLDEDFLLPKPAALGFAEAASTPLAALTALLAIREVGGTPRGTKVLIQGASGGVGMFAVQLAKHAGAEVTAVASGRNHSFVRSLGADHVIDYAEEDWTSFEQKYDVILAINGYHPICAYARRLTRDGIYLCVGGENAQFYQSIFLGPLVGLFFRRTLSLLTVSPSRTDYEELHRLLDTGRLQTAIDRVYPFEQVPDALRYLEQGHARGKVVVQMLACV